MTICIITFKEPHILKAVKLTIFSLIVNCYVYSYEAKGGNSLTTKIVDALITIYCTDCETWDKEPKKRKEKKDKITPLVSAFLVSDSEFSIPINDFNKLVKKQAIDTTEYLAKIITNIIFDEGLRNQLQQIAKE